MPKKILILFILCVFTQFTKQGTKTKVSNLFPEYDKEIYSGYLDTLIEGNKLFYVYFLFYLIENNFFGLQNFDNKSKRVIYFT